MNENSSQALVATADFYRRRDRWIDWCLERDDLHQTTRLVGVWMARRMNAETRNTWYQISTIAERLGVKPRTIIRSIQALEAAEMIVVRRDGRRGLKKGRQPIRTRLPVGLKVTLVTLCGSDTGDT